MSPRFAHAYSNRGMAYAGLGNHSLAIADFDKAVEFDPSYAHAYYNRGMIYNALGHQTRAIADFDKAIEIDPRYADAYSNRGAAYSSLGDYAKALSDFTKAIEIQIRGRGGLQLVGALPMAAWATMRKPSPISRRPSRLIRSSAKAYSGRGAAYGSFRNYTQAIADFGRAIEIDPRDVGSYVDRAAAYAILGKRGQAIADMRTAARLGNEGAKNLLKSQKIDW